MNYALYVSRDAPKRAAEILDAMTPDDLAAAVPEELVESLRAQLEIAEPAFSIESTPATTRRLLTPGDVESPIVVRITNLPGSAADRFWAIVPSTYTTEPSMDLLEDGVEFLVEDPTKIDRTVGIVWDNAKRRVKDLRQHRALLLEHLTNIVRDRRTKAEAALVQRANRRQQLVDAGVSNEEVQPLEGGSIAVTPAAAGLVLEGQPRTVTVTGSSASVGPFRSETGAIVITAQLRAEAIEHLETALTTLGSPDFEPTEIERLVLEEIAIPDIERALSALRMETDVVGDLLRDLREVNRRLGRVRAVFSVGKHAAQVVSAVNTAISILDKLR